MGFGGISIWQLLIVLAIIILLFGTKKLRTLGGDLGNAVKGFRGAMKEAEESDGVKKDEKSTAKLEAEDQNRVIDAEVTKKDEKKV